MIFSAFALLKNVGQPILRVLNLKKNPLFKNEGKMDTVNNIFSLFSGGVASQNWGNNKMNDVAIYRAKFEKKHSQVNVNTCIPYKP